LERDRSIVQFVGMKYRFALCRENYEEFAGGRVLRGGPGSSAFPVRLATELFQRCASCLALRGALPPYTLYDPCCGEGYLLTVLGFMHGAYLHRIVASDIDPLTVERARRNLALLTPTGLDRRLEEIRTLRDAYGKPAHEGALESGARLRSRLFRAHEEIRTECFRFDIAGEDRLPDDVRDIDMIISDLPYGRSSTWKGEANPTTAARQLLETVAARLAPHAVVALVADKQQPVSHPGYRRVESLTAGHRRVTVLELTGVPEQKAAASPPDGNEETLS
jgi:hypothetical protein